MNRLYDTYQSYSWHQSHDQATVLLIVPHDTLEDDVSVIIERSHIVAGVRGQAPVLKGRLYGNVDVSNSIWQLEPRTSRLSTRGRTTSSVSTASTQSSYALVNDLEISSSFAASLEAGTTSDPEDFTSYSPALSSPISSSVEDSSGLLSQNNHRRQNKFTTSHPVSPRSMPHSLSQVSSFSSLESLHAGTGRLLTIHLEKAESVIWPSLIVGPVPEALSPYDISIYPWNPSLISESKYNMDPTSMVLLALDLSDIRNSREEAFEYFVRAWHQAHVPSATIRLSTHYVPSNTLLPDTTPNSPSDSSSGFSTVHSPCVTPTLPHAITSFTQHVREPPSIPIPGTTSYYISRIGGAPYLATLYLEAGLLYLEGTANNLLASSYAGLSSLRTSTTLNGSSILDPSNGNEAWRRDRDIARRFFERARGLDPVLEVPSLPPTPVAELNNPVDPESNRGRVTSSPRSSRGDMDSGEEPKFLMPEMDIGVSVEDEEKRIRRRRKRAEDVPASRSLMEERVDEDEDNTWYLYLPGLVGAGTALLVVGFLSFSSWRKGQGS